VYGGEKLNQHLILRYGLTKEFFETFRSLQYRGIELPLLLINYYYKIIQPVVDQKRLDSLYIERKRYSFESMADIQRNLHRGPNCIRDLSSVTHRNAVLVPGILLPFALKQLQSDPVIVMISNKKDEMAIRKQSIPSNFEIFNFRESIKNSKIQKKEIEALKNSVGRIITCNLEHEVFGTAEFQTWIIARSLTAMKEVNVLENLIRQKKIGVILDHTELVSPGNTLALLGLKFGLPFINVQHYLTTDASIIPSRASHYCVWGENFKGWLESKGISQEKIIPVGSLRLEMENLSSSVNRAELMKQLNIPSHHQIILLTTQPFPEKVNTTIIQWLLKAMKDQPFSVIVKSHPNDHTDYVKHVKEKQNIILNPSGFNLSDFMNNIDYCMTISSNTAIEAAMFGKGILVLQPQIEYNFFLNYNDYHCHLAKATAGEVIENEKELIDTLRKLDQDQEFKCNLIRKAELFLKNTLSAGEAPSYRIFKLIKTLLKNKS